MLENIFWLYIKAVFELGTCVNTAFEHNHKRDTEDVQMYDDQLTRTPGVRVAHTITNLQLLTVSA